MKLVIVTQAVDRDDPNLGAFYYWFRMLADRTDSLRIIAGRGVALPVLPVLGSGIREHGIKEEGIVPSTSRNFGSGTADFPAHVTVETFEHASGVFGRLRRLWRFWTLFARRFADADAVLFHQIPEYALAASPFLLGRRARAVLWYAHGAVSRRLWLAERLVDDVFTSSESGFRLPSKKVFHLGQAINTDLFVPASDIRRPVSELRMITIGRISPVKHYETLIATCAILRDTLKIPWILSIVGGPLTPGDRVYADKLRLLVKEKGLEERIRFEGARPYGEVPALLGSHDLFLNCSRTGSLDKAVLEAMACGLTTLTSNEGYRAILPPAYFVAPARPELFAERIVSLSDERRPNEVLRDIVVRDHALRASIDRMADLLFQKV